MNKVFAALIVIGLITLLYAIVIIFKDFSSLKSYLIEEYVDRKGEITFYGTTLFREPDKSKTITYLTSDTNVTLTGYCYDPLLEETPSEESLVQVLAHFDNRSEIGWISINSFSFIDM